MVYLEAFLPSEYRTIILHLLHNWEGKAAKLECSPRRLSKAAGYIRLTTLIIILWWAWRAGSSNP